VQQFITDSQLAATHVKETVFL